jgi:hypothetical protein
VLTTASERHGGWAIEARYYEDWDEWVTETCTRTISCGKDCTKVETYDCSHRVYHPPQWKMTDSNGYELDISRDEFESLADKFGNRTLHDMGRWYYLKDGDMYSTKWNKTRNTFQPVTTYHRYENRVQATHGVLDFPKVNKREAKELGLYDYPTLTDYFNDPAILGECPGKSNADKTLQYYNARYGREKQIRFWILLFKDKPSEIGLDQESYWVGGNKNELVITIGIDNSNQVMWCHPFCWAPDGNSSNEEMKIEIRDFITSQKTIQILPSVEFIVKSAVEKFERKQFKEFSYLTVDPPTWSIVLIWILIILNTVFMSWWILNNDIHKDNNY